MMNRLGAFGTFGAILCFTFGAEGTVPRCHGTEGARSVQDKFALARQRGIEDPWNYELDHYIPLCLGGPDTAENLRFQPWPQARLKDEDEAMLCREVCNGNLTVEEAVTALHSAWPPPAPKVPK
jgi:hypothetical protein